MTNRKRHNYFLRISISLWPLIIPLPPIICCIIKQINRCGLTTTTTFHTWIRLICTKKALPIGQGLYETFLLLPILYIHSQTSKVSSVVLFSYTGVVHHERKVSERCGRLAYSKKKQKKKRDLASPFLAITSLQESQPWCIRKWISISFTLDVHQIELNFKIYCSSNVGECYIMHWNYFRYKTRFIAHNIK